MQNKLQELTDKLYQEGLSKGKQEAEAMLEKAREEAAAIIKEAQAKAAAITAKAESDAAELKTKVEGDVRMASTQALAGMKQQIEGMITAKTVGTQTKAALSDASFIKELISQIVGAFKKENEDTSLEVILPENMASQLKEWSAAAIAKELGAGIEMQFSKSIAAGMRIAPKGEGYFISLSDADFSQIISQYLRPATKKILFSEGE